MRNRGKMTIIGLSLVVAAGVLVSFTSNKEDEKMKRYQIIHHKDGELEEYDTLLPQNSTFTVENFLAEKGIENKNVEIVKIPSVSMHKGKNGEHVIIKELSHDSDSNGDGESMNVQIFCELDDDGNMTTKKIVDGEEVELTEEELEQIMIHHSESDHAIIDIDIDIDDISEMIDIDIDDITDLIDVETETSFIMEEVEGEGEVVKIICEKDEDGNVVTKKFVNEEEVEMTPEELEELEQHQDAHGKHMVIKIDGEEELNLDLDKMLKELKIELSEELDINLEEIMKELETVEGELENHKIIMKTIDISTDGLKDAEMMKVMRTDKGEDFTIVLVTEGIDAADEPTKTAIHEIASESNITTFPNPNEGVFTLRLNQAEKAKTKIEITDMQGKVVFKENLGRFSGTYEKGIDLKEFGTGVYLINIQEGGKTTTEKVVVK